MSGKQREKWIDLVKCIAILIVMLNHSQLALPQIRFWGGMFFVPVFFVISGFTYHSREESFLSFLGRRARRLLVPYIAANGILFAFFFFKDVVLAAGSATEKLTGLIGIFYARNQLFLGEATKTLWLSETKENVFFLTNLNSPTWFLPALFLTMVLFELLFRMTKGNERKMILGAVILLCFANLYHYMLPILLPWSFDAIAYFLLQFMWGYFMRKKDILNYVDQRKWILLIMGCVFFVLAKCNGSVNYSIADYGISTTMALYNALASSTLVMYVCYKANKNIPNVFAIIGQHTMLLLCYHLFVFSIWETIFGGLWPGFTIVVATVGLTLLGWGKEKLAYAKKQSN